MASPRRFATSTKVLSMFLATMLAAPLALAGTEQDPLNVFNSMAHEMVECAAYFAVVSVALENSNDPESAKEYEGFRDMALERAAVVTEQAGLKLETVAARFEMAVKDMTARIDKNTSNISILMTDYHDLCIKVMNEPEKRGQYWIERGAKKLEDKLRRSPQ